MFPAEPIPDSIGSYKIIRRLPGAGAAEVYLARAEGPMGFARECELKLMPDTSDGDASYAEELAREAAICARLNNPAVVRVFDFFEHQGKLVLALEHVDGTTLAELVQHAAERHNKLGDGAIFHIGARIAGALGDAHAAHDEQGNPTPIIHRNLSPDTVMISAEGDVRLTGFGVGKILGRTPDTAIGRIKGTPGYMAPEQARGEPVTTKADVYGLGLLLWSLLAAKRPPTDGTWPRRISNLRHDLPKEVAALVDAALDHFPGTRKITAREIEQWLSKAAPTARGKTELRDRVAALRAESRAPESPPPPSSRRRIASAASPYQGVRFGAPASSPHTPPSSAPDSPATQRMSSPGKPSDTSAATAAAIAPRTRMRTQTVTGVGNLALNLPSPSGEAASGASDRPPEARAQSDSSARGGSVARRPARVDPEPSLPAPVPRPDPPRFGAPDPSPAPAAVETKTLPSRAILATEPIDIEEEVQPISAIPISAAPSVPAPAARPAPPRVPASRARTGSVRPPASHAAAAAPSPGSSSLVATPPPGAAGFLLAPVMPLAPMAAPPPVEPTSSSIRFGTAPVPASAAPSSVGFGTPPPTVVLTPPPGLVASPAPAPVAFAPAPPPVVAAPVPVMAAVAVAAPPPPPPMRRPMPSLLTIGPGRRSLSAMGAVVVSAITATLVVTVALVIFARRDKPTGAGGSASSSAAASALPPPATAAPVPPRATASASAEASAGDLPFGYGYLTVVSPANANVFVSGKLAGPVNKPLKVRCGRWFIRLAAPQEGGHYPEWVSPGETAVVPCQESTRLEMGPKQR